MADLARGIKGNTLINKTKSKKTLTQKIGNFSKLFRKEGRQGEPSNSKIISHPSCQQVLGIHPTLSTGVQEICDSALQRIVLLRQQSEGSFRRIHQEEKRFSERASQYKPNLI